MKKYKLVAVIWDDHIRVNRSQLSYDIEKDLVETLTFGILVKKTKDVLVVVSEVEKYSERDDLTYMIIIRKTVRAIKEYGEIEVNLRIAP